MQEVQAGLVSLYIKGLLGTKQPMYMLHVTLSVG